MSLRRGQIILLIYQVNTYGDFTEGNCLILYFELVTIVAELSLFKALISPFNFISAILS